MQFQQAFNRVVVHYDGAPACQDYGPIFLADNMTVTLAPPPIMLTNVVMLPDGAFQFAFAHTSGASFTALGTMNLSAGSTNWTVLGGVNEISPGWFQFTDSQATKRPMRFYGVRSP